MADVTGRDGMIITEALGFAYARDEAAAVGVPADEQHGSMRTLLFARLGRERAEFDLGLAMLTAWNLRADVPPSAGRTTDDFRDNLQRIREQVLQEPPGDADTPLLVRHIDRLLAA